MVSVKHIFVLRGQAKGEIIDSVKPLKLRSAVGEYMRNHPEATGVFVEVQKTYILSDERNPNRKGGVTQVFVFLKSWVADQETFELTIKRTTTCYKFTST